ncbi:MAG TPA: hypothetical protein VFI11_12420, partial [Anaerolineales bacterium]|nr:hypothetical protein [Anaerolineales bacterium]
PAILRAARALILFDAILWLAFAAIIAAGVHPSYPDGSIFQWPMAAGGLGGAILMLAIAWILRAPGRLGYRLSVAILAGMVLLGLFDQVGLADLAFMILPLIPLVLLVKGRAWYFRPRMAGQGFPLRTSVE